MKTNIHSIGFTAQQELLDFVNSKTEKLFRLYQKTLSCEVVLRVENSESGDDKSCIIKLAIPGNDLIADVRSGTFESAVLLAIEALERQIRKKKTKLENEIRRSRIDNG